MASEFLERTCTPPLDDVIESCPEQVAPTGEVQIGRRAR